MTWVISLENLEIKYAVDFLNSMGYNWDGKIVGKEIIPETIYDFDCPQIIKLDGEEKGLILYDELDESPECIIYQIVNEVFVTEKDLTKEWIEFLKQIKI